MSKKSGWSRGISVIGVVTFVAAMLSAYTGAQAALFITNNTQADQYQITQYGGGLLCSASSSGCLPLGETGFIVPTNGASSAPTLNVTASVYQFTYLGGGDSVDGNMFTLLGVPGAGTFCSQSFGTCTATPIGTSFTVTLPAGAIPFEYIASVGGVGVSPNGTAGCTLTNGSSTIAGSGAGTGCQGADYFVGIGGSVATPINNGSEPGIDPSGSPLTGPGAYAYIGLTDLAYTGTSSGDFDFQDLGVEVQQIPEPATLTLFGIGALGMLAARKRRAAR